MPFTPCERLETPLPDAATFWELMGSDPRPRLLPGGSTLDFATSFGQATGGGRSFDFGPITDERPYVLSNPGSVESEAFKMLRERHPLPSAVRAVDLTPMISVGLNGTGQTDLGRHYHGVTAMLLLQGRKIWALRPPADPVCRHGDEAGECGPHLDVCALYTGREAPAPACVQEAGETIVIPDGWYHGTCNNASWTVGWGGQNRRMALAAPPRCFHCRPASRPRFLVTEEAFVGEADARAIAADLRRSRRRRLDLVGTGGGAGLAVSLGTRALFMQLLGLRMEEVGPPYP